MTLTIGDVFEVTVQSAASGGQCVARHDGQVAFIRDVIPGERVRAVVTSVARKDSFVRAALVEVLTPSPLRVDPPCPVAGTCGGCDWQHVQRDYQLELKRDILIDAIHRTGRISQIAGKPLAEAITTAAIDGSGLRWRTRMRYGIAEDGTVGLRAARSHQIIPASDCLLPVPELADDVPAAVTNFGDERALVAVRSNGQTELATESAHRQVRSRVRERDFAVDINGFWQVHESAPEVLVNAVLSLAQPNPEHHVLDLFSGVGLFAAFLGEAGATVSAVESNRIAVDYARLNTADLPNVTHTRGDVARVLRDHSTDVDTVVLDPPRNGAGRDVVNSLIRIGPNRIVYVSCDAGTFARDARWLADGGYTLTSLRGFDLFPMTKHLETVGLFELTDHHDATGQDGSVEARNHQSAQ